MWFVSGAAALLIRPCCESTLNMTRDLAGRADRYRAGLPIHRPERIY